MGEPRTLGRKIGELTWEIAQQPGSNGNMRVYHENGDSYPVSDLNTILLWEILKAVSRS